LIFDLLISRNWRLRGERALPTKVSRRFSQTKIADFRRKILTNSPVHHFTTAALHHGTT